MGKEHTLSHVLSRCRFMADEQDLERTLPGVAAVVPPLSVLQYKGSATETQMAYPVVPSPPLLEQLVEFVAAEVRRGEKGRLETVTPTRVEELQQEPYFSTLAELLAQTRAHGTVFRLDSVLWIHLSEIIAHVLNVDEAFTMRLRQLAPSVREASLNTIRDWCGASSENDLKVLTRRRMLLQGLSGRNEVANLTISQMVGDQRPNPLQAALHHHRLSLLLAPGFVPQLDLRTLMAVRDYSISTKVAGELFEALRAMIEDLYHHRYDQALSGTEHFFVTEFLRDDSLARAAALDRGALPQQEVDPGDTEDRGLGPLVAWSLVFRDDVVRYLLSHLEQINSRRALKRKMGHFSKYLLGQLEAPGELRRQEDRLLEVAADVRALDFFDVLRGMLVDVEQLRGTYFHDGVELRRSSAPVDLGSYYELYRRNRSGTAVFIDLIGFTGKTRELFFSTAKASVAGDVELHERGELAALALERLFRVREELDVFGGRSEGFEGDAILDILPDPLSALRYVARFKHNFADNTKVQFRPFARPVSNPFAQEGFRVGIATGDYTQVNVPDTDQTGAARTRLRAIGPTINRASRLNSGKRGGEAFLTAGAEEARQEERDPLGIFEVSVRDEELNNTGICLDGATFTELKSSVRRARVPLYLFHSRDTFEIDGRAVAPACYRFDLIFQDPETGDVFALRRLPTVPKLKGIDRAESVVYEALILDQVGYLEFLDRDAQAASRNPGAQVHATDSTDAKAPFGGGEPGHLSTEVPDYMFERSHGRKPWEGDTGASPAPPPEPDDDVEQAPEGDASVAAGPEELPPELEDSGGIDSSLDSWAQNSDAASMPAGLTAAETAGPSAAPAADPAPDEGAGFPPDPVLDLAPDEGADFPPDPLLGLAPDEAIGLTPDPEAEVGDGEDLDDDELQAYLSDFLNKFEGVEEDEEDSSSESGPMARDDALFVPFASEGTSSDPDAEPEDAPAEPTPTPFSAVDREPSEDSMGAEGPAVPDWPGEGDAASTATFFSDGAPNLPEPESQLPPPPESLLGPLDAAIAGRVRDALRPAAADPSPVPVVPGKPVNERVAETGRTSHDEPSLSPPDLRQLLADYVMVVQAVDGRNEVWIGRLFRNKLFDLHRYDVDAATTGGLDVDDVLERFLRDKIDENFLTFGTRFESLPEDGSEPVPLPLTQTQQVLARLL